MCCGQIQDFTRRYTLQQLCTRKYSGTIGVNTPNVCLSYMSNPNSPAGSNERINCACNRGFTGPDGVGCSACVAGKYKVQTGNAACSNCLAGQYSGAIGATTDVCQICLSNSNSPVASTRNTNCICNVGFTGPNGKGCSACEAGKSNKWAW